MRDRDVWRRVLLEVAREAPAWGGQPVGVVDSGLPGPKGNREFFLHLCKTGRTIPDLDALIDRVVREAGG